MHPAVQRIALDLAGESSNPIVAIVTNLKRLVALRRVLRQVKPDISLGMMTTANVLLSLAALRLPSFRVIGSERIFPPMLPVGRLWAGLRRFSYPLADRITMLTSKGLAWLNAEIPGARGVVMPNPVLYPLPVTEPALIPESLIDPERRLLLAVGRLDQQKGFDFLLTAFANLAPANTRWDLVVLGDGSLRQALESPARALGLQGRVFLPGRAGNVSDWYRRADLYVMSSRFEGFPNTLGEAMAHGCAAVSFDCDTGPRDIIRHDVDGLLVPNCDVAALADALGRLMADEALRQRLAGRAIEVRERFSIEKIAGMWERLFVGTRDGNLPLCPLHPTTYQSKQSNKV